MTDTPTPTPTLDEVRIAKHRVAELLRGRPGLAGIGIGRHRGKLIIRVNWRELPPDIARLDRVGPVTITHCQVDAVTPQEMRPTRQP